VRVTAMQVSNTAG